MGLTAEVCGQGPHGRERLHRDSRRSLLTAASMLAAISSAVVPDSEYCIDMFTICTVTKLMPRHKGPVRTRAGTATPPSKRTKVRRLPERGRYDTETIESILDEGFVCHLGLRRRGIVRVVPTAYARVGDVLYLHGAVGNAALKAAQGAEVCVTVTLVDGLVLARAAFHHSINYRSVTIYGTATEVTDHDEKRRALDAVVEHIVPGRGADAEVAKRSRVRRPRDPGADQRSVSEGTDRWSEGRRRGHGHADLGGGDPDAHAVETPVADDGASCRCRRSRLRLELSRD